MSAKKCPVKHRWFWVPVTAMLASTLVFVSPGAASDHLDHSCDGSATPTLTELHDCLRPYVVESSFTSTPSLRSSDWTVDGDFWERPSEDSEGTFDTYASGDVIEITHRFDRPVLVSGTVGTTLWIGDNGGDDGSSAWRGATYASGSGTDSLTFQYTVTDSDLDADGVSIGSGSPEYPGIWGSGNIRAEDDGFHMHHAYSGVRGPDHKVGPVPYVTGVEVIAADVEFVHVPADPVTGIKTIPTNGVILLAVTYNTPVEVEGDPTFLLHIGSNDSGEEGYRDARFRNRHHEEHNKLYFEYFVEGGLSDTDGISVIKGHVVGSADDKVVAVSGSREAETYSFREYRGMTEFQVDAPAPPRATSFRVVSEPTHRTDHSDLDNAYAVGDEIKFEVTFSERIRTEHGYLPGPAVLPINVGGKQRGAINDFEQVSSVGVDPGHVADGTGYVEYFSYVVQDGDIDADGISILPVTEDNLYEDDWRHGNWRRVGFNSHIVGDESGLLAEAVHDGMSAQSGHRVGNIRPYITGVEIVSGPAEGVVYSTEETIEVAVTFDTPVEISDGSEGGFPSEVSLHIDDGDPDEREHPRDLVSAFYERGNGTDTIVFAYTLEGGESDSDGISVYGFTGGGTSVIEDRSFDWEVVFGDSDTLSPVFSSNAGHQVDAPSRPTITAITVDSSPRHPNISLSGIPFDAYNAGDEIRFKVTFDQDVRIAAEAQPGADPLWLDINVGGTIRRADFVDYVPEVPGSDPVLSDPSSFDPGLIADSVDSSNAHHAGSGDVYFVYQVQAEDYDDDGVSIDASGASGHGGFDRIRGERSDLSASADYGGLSDHSGHRVGGFKPRLLSVAITNAPADDVTYYTGEIIQITLNYNTPVTVDDDRLWTPYFQLAIGPNNDYGEDDYRSADYVSGTGTTALVFEYTVVGSDNDTDGIRLIDGPWHDGDIYATSGERTADSPGRSGAFGTIPDYNVTGTRRIGGI